MTILHLKDRALSGGKSFQIEVCVEGVEDALAAEMAGATRIEINCALQLDGLTPSQSTCAWLKEHCQVPIVAMLRPHANGFVYSSIEQQLLLVDCERLLSTGVEGIAFGALDAQGDLDCALITQVARLCGDRELVMHRAFDQIVDQRLGLEKLIDCGVRRVLTSGAAPTAELGLEKLRKLQEWSRGRIEILPAAGINSRNAGRLIQETGCDQLHGTFRIADAGPIRPNLAEIRQVRDLIRRLQSC